MRLIDIIKDVIKEKTKQMYKNRHADVELNEGLLELFKEQVDELIDFKLERAEMFGKKKDTKELPRIKLTFPKHPT